MLDKNIKISFNNEKLGIVDEEIINRLFNNPPKIVGVKEGLCSIAKDPLNEKLKVLKVKYPGKIIQESKTRWRLVFNKSFESSVKLYSNGSAC